MNIFLIVVILIIALLIITCGVYIIGFYKSVQVIDEVVNKTIIDRIDKDKR